MSSNFTPSNIFDLIVGSTLHQTFKFTDADKVRVTERAFFLVTKFSLPIGEVFILVQGRTLQTVGEDTQADRQNDIVGNLALGRIGILVSNYQDDSRQKRIESKTLRLFGESIEVGELCRLNSQTSDLTNFSQRPREGS